MGQLINDFRKLWYLSTMLSIIIIALSFYLSPEDIESGALSFLSIPHDNCPFCGMSHSFTLITDGQIKKAFAWNSAGPIVYAVLLLNILAGILYRSKKLLRRNA